MPSRSIELLSRAVITGMAVVVATYAAIALTLVVLRAALSAEDLTYRQVHTYTSAAQALKLVLILLLLLGVLGTAAAFLAWHYLAHCNLDRLGGSRPRWPHHWVLIAWLVPVVNLVAPPAMLAQVAEASVGRRAARLVWAWWSPFCAALAILGWATLLQPSSEPEAYMYMYGPSQRLSPEVRATVVDAHTAADWAVVLPVGGLLVIAAVFGVRVVRTITAAQQRRLGEQPGP